MVLLMALKTAKKSIHAKRSREAPLTQWFMIPGKIKLHRIKA
jgi:hypothetical protein